MEIAKRHHIHPDVLQHHLKNDSNLWMGAGYYKNIVQWSKGDYALANNLQDDLVVMTTNYGVTFRADDHGNTTGSATPLAVVNSTGISGKGIIERPTDKDYFSFTTGTGALTLGINPDLVSPNLDIRADLLDAAGNVVASSNPAGLSASISAGVAAGTYYLAIDGVGMGDPLTTGYSDYGSLGAFTITGAIVASGTQAPIAVASATPTIGNAPLSVNFTGSNSSDPDGSIVSYAWNFGDGVTATGPNPSHSYPVKGNYNALLTVTDNDGITHTASVQISVLGPPAAPSNLSVIVASSSQINLAWADNANDETGFKIQRSTNNVNWTDLATVGANTTSYNNTGLSTEITYYYRVKAYNANGESAFSNTAGATIAIPATIHVGNLNGASSSGTSSTTWTATVTITAHDASHRALSGVNVVGGWSNGTSKTCTTGTNGQCNVTLTNIAKSTSTVTYTVNALSLSSYVYSASSNHDPDGSSNGTFVRVRK